jgi:hypothetical protein
MKIMLDHSAQSGTHSFVDRGPDFYATPPEAVRALLQVERLPPRVWDPASGRGGIAETLRAAGHEVHASDLRDRGCPNSRTGIDFLSEHCAPASVTCVVCNPPYKLAEQFVAHAIKLCPRVVMLLRLAFLESERRSPLLDHGLLARVCVFRNRLPMMHRHDWQGPRASSAIAFSWFTFDRNHQGPTILDRISWRQE